MENIMEYIKNINYKKLMFYLLILIIYIVGFLYLNKKINTKEIIKEDNIVINEDLIENEQIMEEDNTEKEEFIYVDIKGAVKVPGVYKLNINSRVIDAINISGGLTKSANTNYINLSKILADSEVVKIYTNDEIKKIENDSPQKLPQIQTNIKEENQIENKLININTATKEQLQELNGIGESKANSIIEFRTTNGLFKSIEEIKNVSGISDTIYDKIKEYITI